MVEGQERVLFVGDDFQEGVAEERLVEGQLAAYLPQGFARSIDLRDEGAQQGDFRIEREAFAGDVVGLVVDDAAVRGRAARHKGQGCGEEIVVAPAPERVVFDTSRAERDVQAKFLLRNGADEVVYPEKQVAKWASIRYTADHIRDYIEVDEGHAIFEVEVPEGWIGKTVGELDIRRKYSINIMATKENRKINMAVSPETVLTDKITLLVLGAYKELQRCFRI